MSAKIRRFRNMRKSATKSRDVCYGPGKFTIRAIAIAFLKISLTRSIIPRAFSCLSQWKLPTATNGRDFSREIDRKVHRQNWINLIHCFFVGWSYEYWLSFYIFSWLKIKQFINNDKNTLRIQLFRWQLIHDYCGL